MKNVLFILAFMLTGTLTFANNSNVSTTPTMIEGVQEIHADETAVNVYGECSFVVTVTITFSDGSTVSWDQPYVTDANSLLDCIQKANKKAEEIKGLVKSFLLKPDSSRKQPDSSSTKQ